MNGQGDADPAMSSGPAGRLDRAGRMLAIARQAAPVLVTLIALATIVIGLLPAAALYLAKQIIDTVLAALEDSSDATRRLALIYVVAESVVLAVLLTGRRWLSFARGRLHAEMGAIVSVLILEKSARLSLAELEDAELQQSLIQAKQFSSSRPFSLVARGFDLLQHGLTLAALMVILVSFSPWLLGFVIAGAVPLFIGQLKFSDTAYRFHTGRTPDMRERSYLESLMTGEGTARERLHFRLGEAVMARYRTLFDHLHRSDIALKSRHAWAAAGLGLVSSAVFLGGKLWIVWRTLLGGITLGQMTMIVGALKQGQAAITNLLSAVSGAHEDLVYAANLFALLDRSPEQSHTGSLAAGRLPGDGLRFEQVSFTYPGRSEPALSDVSFHLAPAEALGLVGANGSGKSTLVKLALGLYPPQSGRILLDGTPLQDWSPEALSRRCSVVFQPSTNFKLSVRDNIAAGRGLAEMSEAELDAAAKAGLASELIASLPEGYDTRLSKRFLDGTELSGGQWQRLALARAFANNKADILILDEPTSALDPAAEASLIDRDRGSAALLLISHRLANIARMDRVVHLAGGKIIEAGTPAELLAAGGEYARLFALQAEPYRE